MDQVWPVVKTRPPARVLNLLPHPGPHSQSASGVLGPTVRPPRTQGQEASEAVHCLTSLICSEEDSAHRGLTVSSPWCSRVETHTCGLQRGALDWVPGQRKGTGGNPGEIQVSRSVQCTDVDS